MQSDGVDEVFITAKPTEAGKFNVASDQFYKVRARHFMPAARAAAIPAGASSTTMQLLGHMSSRSAA